VKDSYGRKKGGGKRTCFRKSLLRVKLELGRGIVARGSPRGSATLSLKKKEMSEEASAAWNKKRGFRENRSKAREEFKKGTWGTSKRKMSGVGSLGGSYLRLPGEGKEERQTLSRPSRKRICCQGTLTPLGGTFNMGDTINFERGPKAGRPENRGTEQEKSPLCLKKEG